MFKKKETKKDESKSSATPEVAPVVETPAVEAGPVIKTFGVKKFKDGWRAVTVTSQDGKVIETKLGEPDPYSIVLEQFKLNFGRYLMEIEGEK